MTNFPQPTYTHLFLMILLSLFQLFSPYFQRRYLLESTPYPQTDLIITLSLVGISFFSLSFVPISHILALVLFLSGQTIVNMTIKDHRPLSLSLKQIVKALFMYKKVEDLEDIEIRLEQIYQTLGI